MHGHINLKDLITRCVEGVGLGASLDDTEILALPGIRSPDSLARSLVAIPTLSQKISRYHHTILGARRLA